MTNRQFSFSLVVGVALAALGGVILGKAPVGLGLIALGTAITALALLTQTMQGNSGRSLPSRATVRYQRDSAADY